MFFGSSIDMITAISILIIIIASGIVSSEFSSGTVKFLLINPVSRWKILVSKYASLLSVTFAMLLICYISSAIFSGVFSGFQDIGAPYLYVSGEQVQSGSSFLFMAWRYLLGSIELIMMATLAFTLSSLTRNSAISIGLGVSLFLVGGTVTSFLATNQLDWARYMLFANTNLNYISMKLTPFLGHTITFALIVLAVYMGVFWLTAWDGFVRRDVR